MQSEKDKSWWDIKIININHEYTKAYSSDWEIKIPNKFRIRLVLILLNKIGGYFCQATMNSTLMKSEIPQTIKAHIHKLCKL